MRIGRLMNQNPGEVKLQRTRYTVIEVFIILLFNLLVREEHVQKISVLVRLLIIYNIEIDVGCSKSLRC